MTYHSEKVVREELPAEALLLTREDVQRILRISRTTFDAIKRAGGLEAETVRFGRCYRYRREFVERVARGEVVLPSAPPPSRKRGRTWEQQAREAAAAHSIKAAERRREREAGAAGEGAPNFRKSSLTEVDRSGRGRGAK